MQRILAWRGLGDLAEKVNRLPCPPNEVARGDVSGQQQGLQTSTRCPSLHDVRETRIRLASNAQLMLSLDLVQTLPDAQHRGDRAARDATRQRNRFIVIHLSRFVHHGRSDTREIGGLELCPDTVPDALGSEQIRF
jgi:hypothetical protein